MVGEHRLNMHSSGAPPSVPSGRGEANLAIPDTDLFITLVRSHLIQRFEWFAFYSKVCSSIPHPHHLKGPEGGDCPLSISAAQHSPLK